MPTVRLDNEMQDKLSKFAQMENVSMSEIIKRALQDYFQNKQTRLNPYEVGKNFFGRYGSGRSDLSITYKDKLRQKFHEKHSH